MQEPSKHATSSPSSAEDLKMLDLQAAGDILSALVDAVGELRSRTGKVTMEPTLSMKSRFFIISLSIVL